MAGVLITAADVLLLLALALPPVLRSLTQADIQVVQRQTPWRHLTATKSYTVEDMQAVWNYVRWAATKN